MTRRHWSDWLGYALLSFTAAYIGGHIIAAALRS